MYLLWLIISSINIAIDKTAGTQPLTSKLCCLHTANSRLLSNHLIAYNYYFYLESVFKGCRNTETPSIMVTVLDPV